MDRSGRCHRALFRSLVASDGHIGAVGKAGRSRSHGPHPGRGRSAQAAVSAGRSNQRHTRLCRGSGGRDRILQRASGPLLWVTESGISERGKCRHQRDPQSRRLGAARPRFRLASTARRSRLPRGSGRSRDCGDLCGAQVRASRARRTVRRSLEHLKGAGLQAARAPTQGRSHGHRRQLCPRRLLAIASSPTRAVPGVAPAALEAARVGRDCKRRAGARKCG